MENTIFKQNDIRGKVGKELNLDQVYELGQAIGYYFLTQEKVKVKKIALAIDGRIDSEYIKTELSRALLDFGFDIFFVGICPTPVLYFSLHTLPVHAGIMVTASHNGKEYNGLKICLNKEIVCGSELLKIKDFFNNKVSHKSLNAGIYKEIDVSSRYIDWISHQFKHLENFNYKLAVDFSDSVVSLIFPKILKKLNFKNIIFINDKVDGNFPNHEPDPMQEENLVILKKVIQNNSFDLGIAFDGDGDRAVAITKSQETVLGDKLLCLFAKSVLTKHPNKPVIFDIKCSSYLPKLIKEFGGRPIVSPTGHSIIKTQIKEHGAILAGELSCHFFFKDRYFGYDDGIYAALRILELIHESNCLLDNLLSIIPEHYSSPELRIELPATLFSSKQEILDSTYAFFKQHNAQISTLDGIQASLPYGAGLIRFSNTQPVICLRFESATKAGLEQIQSDFNAVLSKYISIF